MFNVLKGNDLSGFCPIFVLCCVIVMISAHTALAEHLQWSVFGMVGGRGEILGPVPNKEAEFLANVTLFADVTDRMVAGIETNLNQVIGGNTEVLFMPQLHYELDRYWMIQGGVGAPLRQDLPSRSLDFESSGNFDESGLRDILGEYHKPVGQVGD
jgi:hypothetical protein